MKRYILPLVLLAPIPALAGVNTERLGISDMAVFRSAGLLTVNFRINPRDYKLRSSDRVVLTPAIVSGGDTVRLAPVVVAGRRAWYYQTRKGNDDGALLRAGNDVQPSYAESTPYQPWMENSTVAMLADTISECDCDDAVKGSGVIDLARLDYRERVAALSLRYVVPTDTLDKNFSLSGRANVRFMVNRDAIDWSYAGNRAELDSILASVNAVKDDPDATVKEIHIRGYASPEGPYANNVRLARGRTEAVKEYVRQHASFPADVYRTSFVAEDWQGLKAWLTEHSYPGWQEMVAFIDDSSVPVETKNDIFRKRFPREYPDLLRTAYPTLRHTDYKISYNVRKYFDVSEIREVMQKNPRRLSQNELYLLAKSYPQGSKEYAEVFAMAASLFPDDATANLNAASAAINMGDLAGAARFLERAGDSSEADYARGVLAAMNRDYEQAQTLLRRASAAGIADADAALAEIEAILKSAKDGNVTIL